MYRSMANDDWLLRTLARNACCAHHWPANLRGYRCVSFGITSSNPLPPSPPQYLNQANPDGSFNLWWGAPVELVSGWATFREENVVFYLPGRAVSLGDIRMRGPFQATP